MLSKNIYDKGQENIYAEGCVLSLQGQVAFRVQSERGLICERRFEKPFLWSFLILEHNLAKACNCGTRFGKLLIRHSSVW